MDIPGFGVGVPAWAVLLGTLVFLTYLWCRNKHAEITRKTGLKGPMPLPFLGTNYQLMMKGQIETDLDNIKKYGKMHVSLIGGRINIVIAETEMLKQVMVRQFHYFTNRRNFFEGTSQEPIEKMMSVLEDDEWRNVRSAASPAFSGGKLRKMVININQCAENYAQNLSKRAEEGQSFDVKKISGSFAADVIARVAFGIEVDSQKNPSHPFVRYMGEAMDFSFKKKPLFFASLFIPFLAPLFKRMGASFVSEKVANYFITLVEQAIDARKDSEEQHHDFLQLMLDAMDEANYKTIEEKYRKPLTFREVISNCISFFFAAYGTIGDAMSFALYALAKHPDIQQKVRDDITTVCQDKQSCSYDDIKEMVYLDMFIQEVLRLYSPAAFVDRVCSKELVIEGVTFPKDCVVSIPIQSIQMDPEYWSNPEKFDPERFTPEKKAAMNPVHWMPFGVGPRNCIGLRLALLEVKLCLVHLLLNYEVQLDSPNQGLKRDNFGSPQNLLLKVQKRA